MDLSPNSEPGSTRPSLHDKLRGVAGPFGNARQERKSCSEMFHRCSSLAVWSREARPGLR